MDRTCYISQVCIFGTLKRADKGSWQMISNYLASSQGRTWWLEGCMLAHRHIVWPMQCVLPHVHGWEIKRFLTEFGFLKIRGGSCFPSYKPNASDPKLGYILWDIYREFWRHLGMLDFSMLRLPIGFVGINQYFGPTLHPSSFWCDFWQN